MKRPNTPFEVTVSKILRDIIAHDEKYWLENRYIRWGKIEEDLWESGKDLKSSLAETKAQLEREQLSVSELSLHSQDLGFQVERLREVIKDMLSYCDVDIQHRAEWEQVLKE